MKTVMDTLILAPVFFLYIFSLKKEIGEQYKPQCKALRRCQSLKALRRALEYDVAVYLDVFWYCSITIFIFFFYTLYIIVLYQQNIFKVYCLTSFVELIHFSLLSFPFIYLLENSYYLLYTFFFLLSSKVFFSFSKECIFLLMHYKSDSLL